MKTEQEIKQQINELIKPIHPLHNCEQTVQALCEPNACTVNCNAGAVLTSPTEERDILF
jgi:hypothetical protein